MKVLQVNCVYKKGSTGKITYDLHRGLLDAGIDSIVCYGRGETVHEPGVYKTCPEWYSKLNNALTRITGVMYGGCSFPTEKLISIIKREQPDVVHLQCINGYFVNIYRLVNWLKENHIKTVLTLHAEFMYTANCGHAFDCDRWKIGCGACPRRKLETKSFFFDGTARSWRRMKKAFDGFDDGLVVTSVSPWLMERAKQSPILQGKKHCIIFNGVNTEIFRPAAAEVVYQLKQELGIRNEKVIFHATPLFNDDPNYIKGGYYVIKLAEKMSSVKFVVAGTVAEGLQVPDNLILLGKVTNQKRLAALYSMGDVTLLTSKRETFSMVTAESLCCGTPVVGFKAGGPEMIGLKEHSLFVEYEDIEALEKGVVTMFERANHYIPTEYIQQRYSKQHMVDECLSIYHKLVEGGRS